MENTFQGMKNDKFRTCQNHRVAGRAQLDRGARAGGHLQPLQIGHLHTIYQIQNEGKVPSVLYFSILLISFPYSVR